MERLQMFLDVRFKSEQTKWTSGIEPETSGDLYNPIGFPQTSALPTALSSHKARPKNRTSIAWLQVRCTTIVLIWQKKLETGFEPVNPREQILSLW